MRELILERTGVDFMESDGKQLAEVLDGPVDPQATWAELVGDIYTKHIEHTLNQPTHVFDFPLEPFPITRATPSTRSWPSTSTPSSAGSSSSAATPSSTTRWTSGSASWTSASGA